MRINQPASQSASRPTDPSRDQLIWEYVKLSWILIDILISNFITYINLNISISFVILENEKTNQQQLQLQQKQITFYIHTQQHLFKTFSFCLLIEKKYLFTILIEKKTTKKNKKNFQFWMLLVCLFHLYTSQRILQVGLS